jgi:hypothetical protein
MPIGVGDFAMSHRTRLTVSIILAVACLAALVTSVPVSLPYAYTYTAIVTETPEATTTFTNSSALILYEEFCAAMPFYGTVTCPPTGLLRGW